MPKPEKGTPKDIANRMKAKGLQKLRFYCQMCSKQCRDENGFKCHLTSDSHLRQMKIFSENANTLLDSFSAEFEAAYIDTLRRRHGTKRMNANNVYQEVIQDKHHVHMNATKWTALKDFVQYLGKAGKCVVEETERGWYVSYIEKDPALLARREAHERRVEAERKHEERQKKRMEKQRIEAAKLMDQAGIGKDRMAPSSLLTSATTTTTNGTTNAKDSTTLPVGPVKINLQNSKNVSKQLKNYHPKHSDSNKKRKKSVFAQDDDEDAIDTDNDNDQQDEGANNQNNQNIIKDEHAATSTNKVDPADTLFTEEDSEKNNQPFNKKHKRYHHNEDQHSNNHSQTEINYVNNHKINNSNNHSLENIRKENWIRRNILVRIISKKVANGKYYKRKGIIDKIKQKFLAKVVILDTGPGTNDGGDILHIDQDYLETVIPKLGKNVVILNGRGRGEIAKLISLDEYKERATLELAHDGTILKKVDYQDFSKEA